MMTDATKYDDLEVLAKKMAAKPWWSFGHSLATFGPDRSEFIVAATPSRILSLIADYKAVCEALLTGATTDVDSEARPETWRDLAERAQGQFIAMKRRWQSREDEIGRDRAQLAEAREAIASMIAEWDKMTSYGSPLARAANENLRRARDVLAKIAKADSL